MTPAELARRLLVDAPGEALCDSCLALACSTALSEMHGITKALRLEDASFQRTSTCASCARTVTTTVYRSKCAHCSLPLGDADPGFLMGGEVFHIHCLRRLITDETIQLSRKLSRQSRDLIEQSRRRIRAGQSWPPLGP